MKHENENKEKKRKKKKKNGEGRREGLRGNLRVYETCLVGFRGKKKEGLRWGQIRFGDFASQFR